MALPGGDITFKTNAQPREVADAICKALFGNGLPADKRYLAREAISGALALWRESFLMPLQKELEEAKTKIRDEMMRADEALLRLASYRELWASASSSSRPRARKSTI
jgi:hypothetical protein